MAFTAPFFLRNIRHQDNHYSRADRANAGKQQASRIDCVKVGPKNKTQADQCQNHKGEDHWRKSGLAAQMGDDGDWEGVEKDDDHCQRDVNKGN